MLWEAWILSKTMRVMPSEVYFIRDEVVAWCFNRAVVTFGSAVENDLEKARANSKDSKSGDVAAQRTLRKWLNKPGDMTGMFRDPMKG